MKPTILFNWLGLSVALVALTACNQIELENVIQEGEAIDTGAQPLAYSIFEIVTIDLGNGDFPDGEIEGITFERVKVPLVIQDNILSFMVPKLNPGSHKLVFVDKDKPFNISFEVKAQTLSASPASYLESLIDRSKENIEGLEKTKDMLSGEKKSLLEGDLTILKKQNEELKAKAALLKESELADLAYFMEANQGWMDEIKASLAEYGSVLPNGRLESGVRINIEERAKQLMKKLTIAVIAEVKHIPKIVGFGVAGFVAGSFIPLIGNSAGAAIGAGWALGNILLDIEELFAQVDANAEFVQIVADLIMDSKYKVEYGFENGKDYKLLVSRNYRTLFKNDENSSIPEVKSYLGSFKKQLLTEWAKLKSKLPFNLGYELTNPVTVSTSTSKSLLVHSDHLSISDISNSKVTNTIKKEGGRLFVNFKTTEATNQVFQYKINYDNAINGKLSQVNDATLKAGPEYGSITDSRDGNVYKTVKIGSQTWFDENLRYAGNIPEVTSSQAWMTIWENKTKQPAWAYYNNDPNNNAVYGKLYNWYAVNTGTLCPPGWHIPTDAEWTVLTNFLGGIDVAGGKMKSVIGWGTGNIGATNESGFTGLPGGGRGFNGEFYALGSVGLWWSSSPVGTDSAWRRYLYRESEGVDRSHYIQELGLSCRCLRD